jgi:uncharacterized Zn-binding protein involved in type VI secretion
MKHEGRGVIRLNDKTDHGGHVIAASSESIIMGLAAALVGDKTFCPQCKGEFPITPNSAGAKHKGTAYAYQDDLTACGAHLITSLE